MTPHNAAEPVIVSRESLESEDPCEIIESNVSFLNALFAQHLQADEVSQDGLRSYYVDYYLAQVENGGFSQFVYNSRWNQQIIRHVREGLASMGAHAHLKLLERAARILDELGPEGLEQFLEGDYFGHNAERDFLSRCDDEIFELLGQEDLRKLNATWLRRLSNLVVLPGAEMEREVQRRAAAIPDRERRIAAALEGEPGYMKLIRALCRRAGQELSRVTGGDPTHEHEGRPALAWHFITDQGHHYMVETNGRALMFRGDANSLVAEVEAPEEGREN